MDTLQVFKALQSNLWQPHQSIVLPIVLLKRYKIKTYPFSAVVNLDHSSGAGTHWVAIFLEECSKFDIPDYFCSYSSDIPHEIQEFFRKKLRRKWSSEGCNSAVSEYQCSNLRPLGDRFYRSPQLRCQNRRLHYAFFPWHRGQWAYPSKSMGWRYW